MGGWKSPAGRGPISKASDLASLYCEGYSVRETLALGEKPSIEQ